jgi:hypothetical protein
MQARCDSEIAAMKATIKALQHPCEELKLVETRELLTMALFRESFRQTSSRRNASSVTPASRLAKRKRLARESA